MMKNILARVAAGILSVTVSAADVTAYSVSMAVPDERPQAVWEADTAELSSDYEDNSEHKAEEEQTEAEKAEKETAEEAAEEEAAEEEAAEEEAAEEEAAEEEAAEKAEQERIAAEKAEQERLAAEQAAKEAAEKEADEKAAAEQAEQEEGSSVADCDASVTISEEPKKEPVIKRIIWYSAFSVNSPCGNFAGEEAFMEHAKTCEKGISHNYYTWSEEVEVWEYDGGTFILSSGKGLQPVYTAEGEVLLPVPRKTGYRFEGWCKNNSAASTPIMKIEKGMTGDLALFAVWTKLPEYKITYVLNGGENPSNPSIYREDDTECELKPARRRGYDFLGWYTDASFADGTKITRISGKDMKGDITLYARWGLHSYQIVYQLYGGKNSEQNPETYTVEDEVVIFDAEKEGFRFGGWYQYDDFAGFPVTEIEKGNIGDLYLYAKWEEKAACKLVLQKNAYVYAGKAQCPHADLLIDGKKLTENRDYTLSYENNKDVGTATVTATGIGDWEEEIGTVRKTFVITPAGITITAQDKLVLIGTALPKESEYTYETAGLLADDTLITEPTLACSVTAADMEKAGRFPIRATDADAGANYTIDYEDGTLVVAGDYVVHEVRFDVRGRGEAPETLYDVKTGSTIDAPDDSSAEGYQFSGWYKDAACTAAWDFASDTVQSDITLYAKWLKKSVESDFALQEIGTFFYTGKAIKPAVSVYDGDVLLKAGKDYNIKYVNNVNANLDGVQKKGTGQGEDFDERLPYVQITGKGDYDDVVKVNFDIKQASIGDGSDVPADRIVMRCNDQLVAANKAQKPFGSIRYLAGMKENKDFTLTLVAVDARERSGNAIENNTPLDKAQVPAGCEGKFLLTVTGIGNYTGSVVRTVFVTDRQYLMKNAKITLGKNLKSVELADGRVRLTPGESDSPDTFTVKMGKTVLVPGTDYTVRYRNNDRVGKAELVVTGTGDYAGTKSAAFTIRGKKFDAKNVTVTGFVSETVYTGRAITQNGVTLVYGAGKAEEQPLQYGRDYTVSYQKNINRGTAAIVFRGNEKAGFSGSFKKTFRIVAEDIVNTRCAEGMDHIVADYGKSDVRPESEIVLTNACGFRLKNGKDYTLSYKNNRAVAKATDEKAPTITIKGKGNYKGTFSVPFTITQADLKSKIDSGEIVVKVAAAAYQPKKNAAYAYRPGVTLTEGKKTLRAGKDYTVSYVNNTQEAYEAYIAVLDQKNGQTKLPAPGVVITTPAESGYRIGGADTAKAGAGGNFSGIEVPLRIYRNKLTKNNISVSVSECVYNGLQQRPEVIVAYSDKDGSRMLEQGKDYALSYGANVRSGKKAGSVTISGIGMYYGSDVTVKFEIKKKKIKY